MYRDRAQERLRRQQWQEERDREKLAQFNESLRRDQEQDRIERKRLDADILYRRTGKLPERLPELPPFNENIHRPKDRDQIEQMQRNDEIIQRRKEIQQQIARQRERDEERREEESGLRNFGGLGPRHPSRG